MLRLCEILLMNKITWSFPFLTSYSDAAIVSNCTLENICVATVQECGPGSLLVTILSFHNYTPSYPSYPHSSCCPWIPLYVSSPFHLIYIVSHSFSSGISPYHIRTSFFSLSATPFCIIFHCSILISLSFFFIFIRDVIVPVTLSLHFHVPFPCIRNKLNLTFQQTLPHLSNLFFHLITFFRTPFSPLEN